MDSVRTAPVDSFVWIGGAAVGGLFAGMAVGRLRKVKSQEAPTVTKKASQNASRVPATIKTDPPQRPQAKNQGSTREAGHSDRSETQQSGREIARHRVAWMLVSTRNPLLMPEREEAYHYLQNSGVRGLDNPATDSGGFIEAHEARRLYEEWTEAIGASGDPRSGCSTRTLKALQDWWFSRGLDPGTQAGLGGHMTTSRTIEGDHEVLATIPREHPLAERWRTLRREVAP